MKSLRALIVNVLYVFSLFGEFVRDMKAQKKRTAMTIFGIIWGTAAVVLMMAVGTSTRRQNITNFRGIGDNIILVFGGTTTKPFEGFGVDRGIRLAKSDVEMLRREIPEIDLISEELSTWRSYLRVGTINRNPMIAGVAPHYWKMRNTIPRLGGRFINEKDEAEKRRVIFLGNKVKDFLFGEEAEAVGETLLLDGVPFRVIGVLQDKVQNSSYNSRDEDRAYIPSSTFITMFGHRYINNMIVTQKAGTGKSTQLVGRIREVLGKKYRFDPTDESALQIWDTAEFFEEFMLFFTGFNVFLVIMGAATLAVGGLGVSNIMYVVVRERTKEIGIKRAVGARRWVIMVQFFAETFFITFVGAAVGFLIAWGIIAMLQIIPGDVKEAIGTPVIDPLVVLVCVSIITFIGFTAGFFPARKASRLDPIQCLNY
jgi:putative ABC transport system permease protein